VILLGRLVQLRAELKAGVLPDRGTVLGLVLATEAALVWRDSDRPCRATCGRVLAGEPRVGDESPCAAERGPTYCWIDDRLEVAAARFAEPLEGGSRQPPEATAGVLLGLLARRLFGLRP
jgi:hypothetical protein